MALTARMTRPDVRELLTVQPREGVMFLSFYLDADGGRRTLPEQRAAAKALIHQRKVELQARNDLAPGLARDIQRSLDALRERLDRILALPHSWRGLVIIHSTDDAYDRLWELPYAVRDALIIDPTPYTGPLLSVLDEVRTAGVAVVDRQQVRFFEYDLGRIDEIAAVVDDVPNKVRVAGWYGLEEKRVLRHIEDHVHRHLRSTADKFFALFRVRDWDRIIVGAPRELLPRFRELLHPYLRERVIGEITAEPATLDLEKVRERVADLMDRADREEEAVLIEHFRQEMERNGNAVAGLPDVLKATGVGAVDTLLVEDGFRAPGVVCPECGWLGIPDDRDRCPLCGTTPAHVEDVVDECIEAAVQYGARVRRLARDSGLQEFGRIGALLRFRPADLGTP